ncbi:MAG: hypothetical protein KGJ43_06685, partial [Acidobacteriota bacterium]|nr:hypothetical protein [Acidobacteriota bacterium]
MSLVLAWVLFPLVMAGVGWGWGTLAERLAGTRLNDALLIPVGLGAALVLAGTIVAWPAIAPASVTVIGIGTVAGLALAVRSRRGIGRWPLILGAATLIIYGAPVLASGEATFTGVVKLDDTATWLNIIDNVVSHGRSVAGLPLSTYRLNFEQANPSYPLGAFILPGVVRGLTGIDMAWVFQPYLSGCAAAVAMALFALIEPIIASARLRALIAFVAAQSALLYAYSQWSGIKELTAAFLLCAGVALAAPMLARPPRRSRELLPLAVLSGGLIQTLSIGAGGWMAPALVLIVGAWILGRTRGSRGAGGAVAPGGSIAASVGALAAMTAACVIPIWTVLAAFLGKDAALFSEGQNAHTRIGNLFGPLKVSQLAGIWPIGDFRDVAPFFPTVLFIAVELAAAAWAIWWGARRRQFGVAFYLVVALLGCAIFYLGG